MKMAAIAMKRCETLLPTSAHHHIGVSRHLLDPPSIAKVGQHTPGNA